MEMKIKHPIDDKIFAKKAELTGLISYQDGSVVSRLLIDKPAGTVTIFAFDEGQGLSEHTAPYHAMVLILDGEADILIANDSNKMKAGEIIVMPANVPHALKAITKFKMMLTMVKAV